MTPSRVAVCWLALVPRGAFAGAPPRIRADEVDLILGLGDSMTVGWAQGGWPLEYRGRSFSAGGDPGVVTLPNLLRSLGGSREIRGMARGVAWNTGRAGCAEDALAERVCKLNGAREGARMGDVHVQMDYLERRMDAVHPDWRARNKVATLLAGMADAVFCAEEEGTAAHGSCAPTSEGAFRAAFASVVERIASSWGPVLLNVLLIPERLSAVETAIAEVPACRVVRALDHWRVANLSWTDVAEWDAAAQRYNAVLLDVAATAAVVAIQPFLRRWVPTSADVEHVDCLHPDEGTSADMATTLWNSMVGTPKPAFMPRNATPRVLLDPHETFLH